MHFPDKAVAGEREGKGDMEIAGRERRAGRDRNAGNPEEWSETVCWPHGCNDHVLNCALLRGSVV